MIESVSRMLSETKLFPDQISFKNSIPFETRIDEANKVLNKYPNRVPIIVEPGPNTVKKISRKKYLVPHDLSVGQFMYVIRQRINLDKSEAIYLFCNGKLAPSSNLIMELYEKEKNDDKFLYFQYCMESTFG